jgi:glycosyltransferase involved in cell wall biosynthesis
MEKCNTDTYLDALSLILRSDRRAWLVLAGRDGLDAVASMKRRFEADGVWNRVRYLGPRQAEAPALAKSIDIYCDTYPWVGGQSLLDAMQGGRPIVGMLAAEDAALDPTGMSSITAGGRSLLSGSIELAKAGDVQDYARIALRYINDPVLRARDGRICYELASRECNAFDKSKAYAEDLRAIAIRKLGVTHTPR